MLNIEYSSRFQRDLKRMKQLGKNREDLIRVIEILREEYILPKEFSPHKLRGKEKNRWECHIEPDWLLTYTISENTLRLIRTGTHEDLFGNGK